MNEYIPTLEPTRETLSTLPEGRQLSTEEARALLHLYPAEVADGRISLVRIDAVTYLTAWNLPAPQPTAAELEAALPTAQAAAQARADLSEGQALLDERFRLYTRALATTNATAQDELREEIQMLLSYLQEVRDAATNPA